MKRYGMLALLIGLLATGCTKQQIALTPEGAGKVTSSTIILVVGQEELEAEIVRSNMAGAAGGVGGALGGLVFGLADAAIENNRAKSAEERVSPLRSQLSDIDFREEMASELKDRLKNSWLHVGNIETTSALSTAEQKKIFENKPGNAVLIINASYKLSPDFRLLKTSAANELRLKDAKEPIYKNAITVNSDPVAAGSEDQAIASWSENNGSRLKGAVREGIKRLADSIVQDISPRAEAATTIGAKKSVN